VESRLAISRNPESIRRNSKVEEAVVWVTAFQTPSYRKYSQDRWVQGQLYFRSRGGEDSHLVHVCTGGVFVEGPVDRIRGVPVRARKN
jgi:hypothetical protein